MGFFKKVGNFFKKVGKGVGKVVNGVGKIAAASGIPIISQAGSIIDAVIPDEKVQQMAEKVQEQGVVKVEKVEETVAQYVTSPVKAQAATQVLTTQLSEATGAKIDDSKAVTNINTWDKIKVYLKKPITWIGAGAAGLVIYLLCRKNGGKRKSW